MNTALVRKISLRCALLIGLGTISLWTTGCHEDAADSNAPASSTNSSSAANSSSNAPSSALPTLTSTNDASNPPNAPRPGNPTPTPSTQ